MLDKSDITGFEKDYYWTDINSKATYQFLSDGTGFLVKENETIKNLKWEYIASKDAIKIGCDGSIFYYIIKETNVKDEYKAVFKSKNSDVPTTLIRTSNKSAQPTELELSFDMFKETSNNANSDGIVIPVITDIDRVDKIALTVFLLLVFIFFTILLKINILTGSLPILITLFISLAATIFAYFKLRNISFYFSKKYKKQLENLIFKK